jgi:hypothetical protein
MKKVIDGKVYNTETAEKIGHWWNGYSNTDFNNCEESLYKTKKGQFFIAGEGGAFSKYSVSCGNGRGGGSGIVLLSENEAREWAEEHLDADDVEANFTVEEG